MALLGKHAMAFSIESASLRIIVYSGKNIQSWYTVPFSPAMLIDGLVSDIEGVGSIMAEAIQENNIPKGGAVCALHSIGTATQTLNIPPTSKRNMRDVVTREIKRNIPSSEDADFVYWQPLPSVKSDEQDIYTLSVPRSNIINMVDACRAAGVTLRGIELKPFALTRAIGCDSGIIVHGELDNIEIVIVDNSFPALFRSISIPGEAQDMGVAAQNLLRELPFTIEYYNRSYEIPINPQAEVYLSGELALDSTLPSEIARATDHPLSPIRVPIECPLGFPLEQFLISVGLMLRKNW